MKLFWIIFYFFIMSMNFVPSEFVDVHSCVPQKKISCIVDSYFPCPPGYYDGCVTNETSNHHCIPVSDGHSCAVKMNLRCPTNFQDGCLDDSTDYHLCIPISGKLCINKTRFNCPSGFEDSCNQ